jgi:hypothetical protein
MEATAKNTAAVYEGDWICLVGSYYLQVYCHMVNPDHWGERVLDLTGHNFRDCIREAREAGWKIDLKAETAYCPVCVAAGLHKKKKDS